MAVAHPGVAAVDQVMFPSVGVPAAMPSLGEGVGLDPDDASAVMEDMNDAEDVVGYGYSYMRVIRRMLFSVSFVFD